MQITIINKGISPCKNSLHMRKSEKSKETVFSYFYGMAIIRHYQIPSR